MSLLDDDEEQLLIDEVRRLVSAEIAPRAAARDAAAEFPTEELAACAAVGLMGMFVPEDYGGFPVSSVVTARVYEEISRVSPAVSVILSVHNSLTCQAIARFG